MSLHKLLQSLKSIPKTYFSIKDIEKYYTGNKKSLPVILHRLIKKGTLQRIMRGYYFWDGRQVDFEAFACEIKKPSYISLESALYHHGFIDQIPETITLVTPGKSRTLKCKGKVLEYAHIKPALYFGYEIVGNTLIATKEKTLLDELYLVHLKKRSFRIQKEWFEKVDRKIFQKYLEKYPEKSVPLGVEEFSR